MTTDGPEGTQLTFQTITTSLICCLKQRPSSLPNSNGSGWTMGCSISLQTRRILIGDLSDLCDAEQRLFSLSYAVLAKEDQEIWNVSEDIGVPILAKRNLRRHDENGRSATEKTACAAPTTKNGTLLVHSGDISLEEKPETITHLYSLLISDKPYYFSQTFSQWKSMYWQNNLFSCCSPPKSAIYIVPVDNFPNFIRDFEIKLDSYKHCLNFDTLLQTFAEVFFDGAQIRLLPAVNLLEAEWNIKTRMHSVTNKKQYFVQDFFSPLKRLKPPDGHCIMGYTWTDLYPTEALNFVLGEAKFSTSSGIFCFGRFEPKTYDPDTHLDITVIDAKLLWRILKVFSHELCHLFGLQHCWYFYCAMNESSSMAEAFFQPLFLCPVCLRKLQYVLEFDVLRRYQKLLRFLRDLSIQFSSIELRQSVKWLEMMIKYLDSDIT